jgi:hypothetical protein
MPQLPILLFPSPTLASRSTLNSPAPRPRLPDHARQVDRLSPKFQLLQQSFEEDAL